MIRHVKHNICLSMVGSLGRHFAWEGVPWQEKVEDPWSSVIEHYSVSSPHVALLPGDDVEHSGDQEEGTQAHAVHPGCDLLPSVV